jgi:hypothetical protein
VCLTLHLLNVLADFHGTWCEHYNSGDHPELPISNVLNTADAPASEAGAVLAPQLCHKTLLDASKEVGLEVNPEKTKYMLVSSVRRQDRGRA